MPSKNWTFRDDQALVVAKAGLLSKGYITESDQGAVTITDRGYRAAYEMWMKLDDEARVLLSTFIKRIIIRNVLGDKGKDNA